MYDQDIKEIAAVITKEIIRDKDFFEEVKKIIGKKLENFLEKKDLNKLKEKKNITLKDLKEILSY